MMAGIPIIETRRLRLRAHAPGDLDACAQMWGDPQVTQYIGGRAFSREEVWARLLRYAGHWDWLGYGFWLVEELATGRFVGEVGIADFKRDLETSLIAGPEAGWVLATHAQGNGFATEALRAVTAWHDERARHQTLSCLIHPENAASIKVATKCGFRAVQQALYKGHLTGVYIRET